MLRQAPDEVDVPGLGLLQWWSEAPFDREHWYVSENQIIYRVTVEEGEAAKVSDANGNLIRQVVTSRDEWPEPALL